MEPDTRICIAYIAGTLISGKRDFCLYDYGRSLHVKMACLLQAEESGRIVPARRVCVPDSSKGERYKYACGCGHLFDIAVQGNTFIGYTSKSASHFIGNVRGDSLYLYDHELSAHFNYRISHPLSDGEGGESVSCGVEREGSLYERRERETAL